MTRRKEEADRSDRPTPPSQRLQRLACEILAVVRPDEQRQAAVQREERATHGAAVIKRKTPRR
jgi:hypothetical protein